MINKEMINQGILDKEIYEAYKREEERRRLEYVRAMQNRIMAAATESLEKAMNMLKNGWITQEQYIEIVRKGVK